jgi:hypothetical protein
VGAGAIAAQRRLLHPVGIDQHAGFGVTLAGAFRDDRRDGLVCEMRFVRSRPWAWAWLTRKAAQSTDRREGFMQRVTFLSPNARGSGWL